MRETGTILLILGVSFCITMGVSLLGQWEAHSQDQPQRITTADIETAIILNASSLQTVAATDYLKVDAPSLRLKGSGGAVTLTSTPTIPNGIDGQIIILRGTDNTNTVTLQDEGGLANSNVELGAATRALGNNDLLVLMFISGVPRYIAPPSGAAWYEITFINH